MHQAAKTRKLFPPAPRIPPVPTPKKNRMDAARRLRAARTSEGEGRPDPVAIRAEALAPIWIVTALCAAALGGLALGAPGWTGGDDRAALLPGVPAALLLILHVAGRAPARRRVSMALATSISGFLALATASSLGALGEPTPAVWFQIACFGVALLHVAVSAPAWRRVERSGGEADDTLRMYEEL